jgi:hypothetical protein
VSGPPFTIVALTMCLTCDSLTRYYFAYLCTLACYPTDLVQTLCWCRMQALIVDYSDDEELEWSRGDFLKLRTHDEVLELMNKGYNHMERLHDRGFVAERWDASAYALQP